MTAISLEKLDKAKKTAVNILLIFSVLVLLITIFGKYRPELILSNSMYPVLKRGNIVLAEEFTKDDTVVSGQIYTYQNPDDLLTITHRCIGIEEMDGEEVYVFKGDNNAEADAERVRKNWIKYRLIRF